MSEPKSRVIERFEAHYGASPEWVVRAPGRVNLIGEHTDYNDGFVLPMAIDGAIWIALRPRTDSTVRVRSLDFDEVGAFDLERFEKQSDHWTEYLKGTAWALREANYSLRGWEGVMAGNVPIGAGLSSSAALELATARAFLAVDALTWNPEEMARHCQRAENEWVGVNCGIMDQMASARGAAGYALLIDCRSLHAEPVPMPPDTAAVIMDTTVRRGLADSPYNERRRQCEAAAQFFDVEALRDVDPETFAEACDGLSPLPRRRARHVVTENARTLRAAQVLNEEDVEMLGRLMNASHASLRDDFAVSSPELDAIVESAQRQEACYGARMTGAGFGGCAVALVARAGSDAFRARIAEQYEAATGLRAHTYVCHAADGVTLERPTHVEDPLHS